MAQQKTVENILQIASVSQYLAFKDKATKQVLKGGYKPPIMPLIISIESMCVQWQYDYDPNNSVLQGAANYVYGLCGGYAIQAENILANLEQAAPVVTGANNQSVQDNASATFTIGVTSTLPYIVQWYNQDGIIPGATSLSYSFTAVLSDSGNVYYAVATSSAGSTQSASGTLTVTETVVAYYYFGEIDYSSELQANTDNVPYVGTFPITPGDPLSYTWPSGASDNKYIVVKYPATESIKTAYANAPINNGLIPSLAFDSIVTFGGWNYIFSRTGNPFSQNTSAALIFS